MFAIDAYLERIACSGPAPATEATLEAVHRAQAYSIPFENFDILLGRGIDLEPEAVFAKLVAARRGGYCFELNQLLQRALAQLGFDVRPLLARVHLSGTPSGRGHMLLRVSLGGRPWIADVGFGGPGLRAPIPLEPGRIEQHDGQTFRLTQVEPYGIMLQRSEQGEWQNLYSFDTSVVVPADITYGNHFTSTHPSSFFTFARVAALPRPDGRVTLFDRSLRIAAEGRTQACELPDDPRYLDALRTHFGIDLGADYSRLKPLQPSA